MAGGFLHLSACSMQASRKVKRNYPKSLDAVAVAENARSRILTIAMNPFKQNKRLLIGIFILCLLATLLYPFEFMVVPEWTLRIIDQNSQRLRGNRVRESWCHYTLENQSQEEELLSDEDGYVQFPRRTIRG